LDYFLPPSHPLSSTFLPHLPALPPGSMLELHIPRDLHPNCSQTGARSSPHFRTGRHLPTTGDSLSLPIWPRVGRDHSSLQERHPMEGLTSLLESSLRHSRD
jgi:hypothetical protein